MKRRIALSLVALVALTMSVIASAAPVAAQAYQQHKVQPFETLAKIARLYCTTWEEVYRLNRDTIGPNPNAVEPGMILTVMSYCAVHLPEPPASTNVYDRGSRTHAAGTFRSPYYTTTWGDTLYSIGQRFGLTADQIREANGLPNNSIHGGMALLIPGASGSGSVPPSSPGTPIPESERIFFGYGNISTTRLGIINGNTPKRYILGGRSGQVLEVGMVSRGEPLAVSITTVNGTPLTFNGENNKIRNNLWIRLPATGDYLITVSPLSPPENPQLGFDVTFIIQ